MRPVSLELEAFGSYAGELRVDFARLARHGIFAISGPTGAGKSTIFDALVYALYDDLPGFRVDGNVRSQFADPTTPTRVCLDFVVHGERWRVERRPTQLLRRRRGEGAPVERKSTVALGRVGDDGEMLPGTGVTKKDQVKRRIDALVGLTKDQFEQVVLIPQGRFEEVLKADTQRRAPLLRRLFPVELFTRVTESVKSIAAARQTDFEEATRGYAGVVERLGNALCAAVAALPGEARREVFGGGDSAELDVDRFDVDRLDVDRFDVDRFDVAELGRHVEELARALRRVDVLVDESASTSQSALARAEEARRMAADWDRWREDLALCASFEEEERGDAVELTVLERARRLADLRGALAEWDEARRRSARLEPELSALLESIAQRWPDDLCADLWTSTWSAARTDAHEAGVLAERLAADARRLGEETGRFDRLSEAARSLEARRLAVERRAVELDERVLKLDAEEQAVALVADEARRLGATASSIDAVSAAVGALEREHQMASRRTVAIGQRERADAELARSAAEVERATALADAVRSSWRDGLAGRLALLLEEGAPCPTCGALEHPSPAEWRDDGPDDDALAAAEAARDDALAAHGSVEQRAAAARGALGVLAETRSLDDVETDLEARRDELAVVREAAERLEMVAAEERRRREDLVGAREALGAGSTALECDRACLGADESAHEREVAEFAEAHGGFESPAARAAARVSLASDVEELARVLRESEEAHVSQRHCAAVVEPVAHELGAPEPGALRAWLLEPEDIDARGCALEHRRARRDEVRRRIADYQERYGARGDSGERDFVARGDLGGRDFGARDFGARPDVEAMERAARRASDEHASLVGMRAVVAGRAAELAAGPAEIAAAAGAVASARRALEQAKTVADRCAGLGGGPVSLRLSLENWVLADYLRQVLVQANHRLDVMTDGRFALELSDGVTDGRRAWGLDLSVFDANTGQVRPATTLSGGETFMAALALALGLADVVSGGSNREVGALFVDEGFGSLDPQSLDAVIDVLASLEDGGRFVGVVSHVRELQRALPAGITVAPSPSGSVATLHYPPD